MISVTALQIMIWCAVVAGALVPLVLLALFIMDFKKKTIW
ncbi:hypothetical protein B0I24_101172 [Aliidiomarina maris]|uniref:Uncharacterized protein n=1 Tax=Aliidiomarina maris TaxID=531312 RepID=A0A327X4I0_9GAMM|nr:hypothetical protein B0I24_101172 [Aliidiomarina maris]